MSLSVNDHRLHELRQSIDVCGYGILQGYIDAQMVSALVDKINAQAKVVTEAYGMEVNGNSCQSLLALSKHLQKSPPGWCDPMRPLWRLPFGAIDKRGWIQGLGSGRMFDGQDFNEDGLCERIQELCRPVFSFLHGVSDHELIRFRERVSVKPGASPKLVAHIDGNRRGSYQAVISLSVTSFLVFPYSHMADFLPRTNGFYKLSKDDITRLGTECGSFETCIPANIGDVLFFVGGDFVHGSVPVREHDPTRYVAYAQFWPSADITAGNVSDITNDHIAKRTQIVDEDNDDATLKIRSRKRWKQSPTSFRHAQ